MGQVKNQKQVNSVEDGRHRVGDNLYLQVKGKYRSWILRVQNNGRRQDIGLGSAKLLTLGMAKDRALEVRREILLGTYQTKKPSTPTLLEVTKMAEARQVFEGRRSRKDWYIGLPNYVLPVLGDRAINQITAKDLLDVLGPLYQSKRSTGIKIKQRLNQIWDHAVVLGYVESNPIPSLQGVLPKAGAGGTKHHPALPWAAVPAFYRDLYNRPQGITAAAYRFLIGTAARSGEVRGATWDEIQMIDGQATWVIPASRMKAKKEHRVPLSNEMEELVGQMSKGQLPDDWIVWDKKEWTRYKHYARNLLIFPSQSGLPLSDAVFKALQKRMDRLEFTPHGFRSSFRDWCADNRVDRDVAELSLAHVPTLNSVEAAYYRTDLIDERRKVMALWGKHITSLI